MLSSNTRSDLRVVTPAGRNFKMVTIPSHADHYAANAFEDFTADLLVDLSAGAELFIDVGAHHGFFSLLVGTAHPGTRVLAFEPVPESCAILRQGIDLNATTNVLAVNRAVSNEVGILPFLVSSFSSQSGFYPSHLSKAVDTIDVETVTLDRYISGIPRGPVVVKIDAEGNESRILEGMGELIAKAGRLIIFMEMHPEMLKRAGSSAGQLLGQVDRAGFDIQFIDDEFKRLRRYDCAADDWQSYFGTGNYRKDYFNILCTRRESRR